MLKYLTSLRVRRKKYTCLLGLCKVLGSTTALIKGPTKGGQRDSSVGKDLTMQPCNCKNLSSENLRIHIEARQNGEVENAASELGGGKRYILGAC